LSNPDLTKSSNERFDVSQGNMHSKNGSAKNPSLSPMGLAKWFRRNWRKLVFLWFPWLTTVSGVVVEISSMHFLIMPM
jgi:hypothetical protein